MPSRHAKAPFSHQCVGATEEEWRETGRSLLVESEPLPLPQLREGRGNAPSQGDVIEAEIPDASGRAVGKVMLDQEFSREWLARESSIYAVQVLGVGKERKEFVVHLCTPQEPGRCEETGAALHCGKWSVVPGEADRGVGGASVETSERTDKGLRPEIAEAGPALFARMDGEGLGALKWRLWQASWVWTHPRDRWNERV